MKLLSVNKFTITDPLKFAEELREQEIGENDLLVSYDVSSLFTNVPVDETIRILIDKAFEKEWFNTNYQLHLKRSANHLVKPGCQKYYGHENFYNLYTVLTAKVIKHPFLPEMDID